MQRVVMPHSSLWIFPPRDERFTRATWQVQFPRPLRSSSSSTDGAFFDESSMLSLHDSRPNVSPAIHHTHSKIHPSIVILTAASLICEHDEDYLYCNEDDEMKRNGLTFRIMQATVNTLRDWVMRVIQM